MQSAPDLSLRILYCRSFRSIATTPAALARLKSLLAGQSSVPGLEIKPRDRWTMLAALLAHADPDASALLHAEQQRDSIGDGRKYAYAAGAARPDAAVKQQYFKDYLENRALQEDWIEQSLAAFNYWNQSALTQPYLDSALASLPQNQARPQDLLHACLAERLHSSVGRRQPLPRAKSASGCGRTRPMPISNTRCWKFWTNSTAPSASARGSIRSWRDGNSAVNPPQRDRDPDGVDLQLFVGTLVVAKSPSAIRLPRELFDADLFLIHQDVVSKRIDSAIELKFQAAIILLGRRQKHLKDRHGIDEDVVIVVDGLVLSANDRDVRVHIRPARYLYAGIGTKRLAGAIL
jgi:hypothetical protein